MDIENRVKNKGSVKARPGLLFGTSSSAHLLCAKRRSSPPFWIGACLAALALVALAAAFSSCNAPPPTNPTPLPVDTATPVPTLAWPTLIPTSTRVTEPTRTATLSSPPTTAPLPQTSVIPSDNAAQITEMARLGKGLIRQMAWSPDSQMLAVASSVGIYLYEAATLREVHFIETQMEILSVAFSPGGETLAAGSVDGTVLLWGVR